MSNRRKDKNKYQEARYYKKGKAARLDDKRYNDYSISDTSVTYYEIPKTMRDTTNKYKTKYETEFEYENEYDYSTDECDSVCRTKYNKDRNKRYYYSSGDIVYHKTRPNEEKYKYYETETVSEYDSNSDYSSWEKPRRRRNYKNRYNGHDLQLMHLHRYHTRNKDRHPRDTTDSERSYYQRHAESYFVLQPRDHHAYKNKQQYSTVLDETKDEILSTDGIRKTNGDSDITKSSQAQYQVYMTQQRPDNTVFSRERLLSVIDYNEKTSPLRQSNKNNSDVEGSGSELVYLPVIFHEKINSNNKITSSKLKLGNFKEGQLQKNVEIFVASNLQQENIFQQPHNDSTMNKEKETSSLGKRKSKTSTAIKRLTKRKSKSQVNENDYPVNKSYIKVVPNNLISNLKSRSSACSKSSSHTCNGKEDNKESLVIIKKDNKGSKVHEYNQLDSLPPASQLRQSIVKNQEGSMFITTGSMFNENILPDLPTYNNQSHNGEIMQTTTVRENRKSYTGNSHERSRILKEHLKRQIDEERKRTPITTVRESTKSHVLYDLPSTSIEENWKNKDEEHSTIKDDHERLTGDKHHISSMDKNNRMENTTEKNQSIKINDENENATKNEQQRSDVFEIFRQSNTRDTMKKSSMNKSNLKDGEYKTNRNTWKSLVGSKDQGFVNGETSKIITDEKQQRSKKASHRDIENAHEVPQEDRRTFTNAKISLLGEKSNAADDRHFKKSATNVKSEIYTIEQIPTTENLENKSIARVLSKRDTQPASQKKSLISYWKSYTGKSHKKSGILEDYHEHKTNRNTWKSLFGSKHQKFGNGETSKIITDEKQQRSKTESHRDIENAHQVPLEDRRTFTNAKKSSLHGKSNAADDRHFKKSVTNVKSEIYSIEQIPTTESLENKSIASVLSKRDAQSVSQKKSLVSCKSATREHSELPKKTKSIIKKRKDKNKFLPYTESIGRYDPSQSAVGMERPGTDNRPIKLWGYNIMPLVYVFQVAQFFLGLTMHEKLMEVANHYYSN